MANWQRSAVELAQAFRSRTVKVVDVVRELWAHHDQVEPSVKAYISTFQESSLTQAAEMDARFDRGDDLPLLAGIPIAIKDNIHVNGVQTTCASQILKGFVPPFNAAVIDRLADRHVIVTGKTNLDEFAMGSSTENSSFHTSLNPWDLSRVPGGSSGGSAVAVASGQAVVSLGSDTGGSIRQPAAFCGVVGLKPTYGRVSRYGLVAFASSLDQIGPFSRTVADSALVLDAIAGHDPKDATSASRPADSFYSTLSPTVAGLRIGVPKELFGPEIDPGVKAKVVAALDLMRANGATWEEVEMPSLREAVSTYYIIAPAEASANLSRFDGVRYGYRDANADNLRDMFRRSRGAGFGAEVKRRIIIGTYVLSSGYYDAYYTKAQKLRSLIVRDFAQAFQKYDVIVTPTAPSTAFKLGEHAANPLAMYLADIATIPVNMAGLPAISVPCGLHEGLPVGLQLVGPAFGEQQLLNVAAGYEALAQFSAHYQSPIFAGGTHA